jgi:hypothetical protein
MHIKELPKVEAVLKKDGKAEYVVVRFENFKKFIQKCPIQGKIDEADYINRYPDTAKAIRQNKVPNATEHYLRTGYAEQRSAKVLG